MLVRVRPGRRVARPGVRALLIAALALAVTGCEHPAKPEGHVLVVDDQGRSEMLRGFAPALAADMPAVTLRTPGGNPYPLRTKTAGKVALVYFGYTHCPDVCPATMATVATAVESLPVAVRDKIAIIFVSTDPDRDTGAVLAQWVRRVDRRVIALRGTLAQVNALAAALRIDPGRPEPLAGGGYALVHGDNVTAFTSDGTARAVYPPTTTIPDWRHDLPILTRTRPVT